MTPNRGRERHQAQFWLSDCIRTLVHLHTVKRDSRIRKAFTLSPHPRDSDARPSRVCFLLEARMLSRFSVFILSICRVRPPMYTRLRKHEMDYGQVTWRHDFGRAYLQFSAPAWKKPSATRLCADKSHPEVSRPNPRPQCTAKAGERDISQPRITAAAAEARPVEGASRLANPRWSPSFLLLTIKTIHHD